MDHGCKVEFWVAGETGLSGALMTWHNLMFEKTFETDDGALIHVTYTGLYKLNAAVSHNMQAGRDAQFGDTLFMTHGQFETGDMRYAWLNETLAVADARETSSGVEYQLYSLSH